MAMAGPTGRLVAVFGSLFGGVLLLFPSLRAGVLYLLFAALLPLAIVLLVHSSRPSAATHQQQQHVQHRGVPHKQKQPQQKQAKQRRRNSGRSRSLLSSHDAEEGSLNKQPAAGAKQHSVPAANADAAAGHTCSSACETSGCLWHALPMAPSLCVWGQQQQPDNTSDASSTTSSTPSTSRTTRRTAKSSRLSKSATTQQQGPRFALPAAATSPADTEAAAEAFSFPISSCDGHASTAPLSTLPAPQPGIMRSLSSPAAGGVGGAATSAATSDAPPAAADLLRQGVLLLSSALSDDAATMAEAAQGVEATARPALSGVVGDAAKSQQQHGQPKHQHLQQLQGQARVVLQPAEEQPEQHQGRQEQQKEEALQPAKQRQEGVLKPAEQRGQRGQQQQVQQLEQAKQEALPAKQRQKGVLEGVLKPANQRQQRGQRRPQRQVQQLEQAKQEALKPAKQQQHTVGQRRLQAQWQEQGQQQLVQPEPSHQPVMLRQIACKPQEPPQPQAQQRQQEQEQAQQPQPQLQEQEAVCADPVVDVPAPTAQAHPELLDVLHHICTQDSEQPCSAVAADQLQQPQEQQQQQQQHQQQHPAKQQQLQRTQQQYEQQQQQPDSPCWQDIQQQHQQRMVDALPVQQQHQPVTPLPFVATSSRHSMCIRQPSFRLHASGSPLAAGGASSGGFAAYALPLPSSAESPLARRLSERDGTGLPTSPALAELLSSGGGGRAAAAAAAGTGDAGGSSIRQLHRGCSLDSRKYTSSPGSSGERSSSIDLHHPHSQQQQQQREESVVPWAGMHLRPVAQLLEQQRHLQLLHQQQQQQDLQQSVWFRPHQHLERRHTISAGLGLSVAADGAVAVPAYVAALAVPASPAAGVVAGRADAGSSSGVGDDSSGCTKRLAFERHATSPLSDCSPCSSQVGDAAAAEAGAPAHAAVHAAAHADGPELSHLGVIKSHRLSWSSSSTASTSSSHNNNME